MAPLKRIVFYLYLLIIGSFAEDDTGNANKYIDLVLDNLRNNEDLVSKFDPIKVPDINEDKIVITDGVVVGLSSLYRSGDFTLTYEDGIVTVSGEIAVKDVRIHMNYKAKALFFWIKGVADGRVSHLSVRMELSVRNVEPVLESFKVTDLGETKIEKITGMSVMLNWALKLIVNKVVKNNRGKIIDALENGAADALRKELSKVKVPDFLGELK